MKSIIEKITKNKWSEFILLIINSYLLGILGWQVVHKEVSITPFITQNIEPAINNPFLSVKIFIILTVILVLVGFFIKLINNHSKTNIRLQFIILLSLVVGINFFSIVSHLPILEASIFGITLNDFLSKTWYWQNLIFVFVLVYYLVFYYAMPLAKRFNVFIKRDLWIYVLIALSIVAYSVLSIGKHNNLQTNTMDLGGYDQAVWKLSHFEAPLSTIYADDISNGDVSVRDYSNERIKQFFPNMLGDHFEPVLAIISPIFWIYNDIRMLLFIQVLIVCLGAWPIYMLAKEKLGSKFAGLCIAASYLFFIGVQTAIEFDFHPLAFVAPILAYLYYFLEKKKYAWVYVFTALALLCKEVASLYIFFFGLYAFFVKKERKAGIIMMISGVLWFILVINIIIPHVFHREYGHMSAYDALGSTTPEILKTMITNPIYTINILFNPGNKIDTWIAMFGATGFLAFLSPATLILAIPMIGEKFLTMSKSSCWTLWWHYSITITPILMIAATNGIYNLKNKYKNIDFNWSMFGALIVIISTLTISFIYSNNPDRTTPLTRILNQKFYTKTQDITDFEAVKNIIPEDASLATTDTLLPHLAHREQVYRVHPTVPDVDYVLINTHQGFWPWSKEDILRVTQELKDDPSFVLKENKGSIYLFENANIRN